MSGGWSKQICHCSSQFRKNIHGGALQEQIQFPKMCDTVTANFAKYPRGSAARLSTKAASAREYSVGVGIIAETKVGMGQP